MINSNFKKFILFKFYATITIFFIFLTTNIFAYELFTQPERLYGDGLGPDTKFCYSLDGSKVAVTSLGVVTVYDTEAWALVGSIKVNKGAIYTSCPSNDGKFLLTGGLSDKTTAEAILWDLTSGEMIQSYLKKNDSQIENIFILPDGNRFLSSSYKYVFPDYIGKSYLWDIESGEILKEYDVMANAVSPDGKTFINTAFLDKETSSIWELETGKKKLDISYDTNLTLFSPDGQTIFSLRDKSVEILNSKDGSLVFALAPEEIWSFGINWVKNIITLMDRFYNFHNYDLTSGNKIKTVSAENTFSSFPSKSSLRIVFSKNGEQYAYLNNRGVSVYDSNTDTEIKSLTSPVSEYKIMHGYYSNMQISADGKKILLQALQNAGKDQIIDTLSGEQLYYLDQWQLNADGVLPVLNYLPNLDIFYTYFKQSDLSKITNKENAKDVKVYLATNSPILIKTFITGYANEARYIPAKEQMMLTYREENLIDILDVKTGNIIKSYEPDVMPDLSDLVSNQGNWFSVSRPNNFICDINSGVILKSFTPYIIGEWLNSIKAVSCDDKYLLSNFGLIWNVDSGEIIHDLNLPQDYFSIVNQSADFSPDGKLLAIRYLYSGNIHIYSTTTWEELYQLEGLFTYSSNIKFTEDSKHLYSCSKEDGYVKYWALPGEQTSITNWQIF